LSVGGGGAEVYWLAIMSQPESSPEVTPRRWTVRVYRLGEEPADDLSALTTPEQRLAMVRVLTSRMWELTGRPVPSYERAAMPGRVLRPA
jgi:hypothetical protein